MAGHRFRNSAISADVATLIDACLPGKPLFSQNHATPLPLSRTSLARILLTASTAYLSAMLVAYVGVSAVERHQVESATYIFVIVAVAVSWLRTPDEPGSPRLAAFDKSLAWWCVAGPALAIAVYGRGVSLGFLSDDFVLKHSALSGIWLPQPAYVRPIPVMIWRLLLSISFNPSWLHLLSIFLHGINAALVGVLAVRLGLPRVTAVAAGLLFLVFPSSVEAVVWPAAIHDVIVATCTLVFLLLAGAPARWPWTVGAGFVLVLGLLSKESAVAIPFLAALLWLPIAHPQRSTAFPKVLTGILVCAVYGLTRHFAFPIPSGYGEGTDRYLLKELLTRPIGTLTLPWASYVPARPVVSCASGLAIVLAAAGYVWRRDKALPWQTMMRVVIALIVAALPVYSLLYVSPDLENARYLYVSTAFWVIAVAGFAGTSRGMPPLAMMAVSLALLAGVVGIRWHLTPWRDAAGARDRVLMAAETAMQSPSCRVSSFASAPDAIRGAFVFRNGLQEAIAFHTGAKPSTAAADCSFAWDGMTFRRAAASGTIQARLSVR